MICCAILVLALTAPLWLFYRLQTWLGMPSRSPLSWRLVPIDLAQEAPRYETPRFCMRTRIVGFRYAFAGIAHVLKFEHTAWLHLGVAASACLAALALQISYSDWRWIVFSIFIVLASEALNTCIESICNLVCRERNEHVRIAKDAGAGAVLLCGIGAGLVGVLTFGPYIQVLIWPMFNLQGGN